MNKLFYLPNFECACVRACVSEREDDYWSEDEDFSYFIF